ncbi:MAG: hypothetical protein WKF89_06415 [Chitinophagaceae bacterium]
MDDQEIRVNDRMFDICSSTLVKGVYTFKGSFDIEETELLKKRNRNTEKCNKAHHLLSQLLKWFNSANSLPADKLDVHRVNLLRFQLTNISTTTCLFNNVPTPPPW